VRRAYKFRAYPTRPQEGRATRLLADHCDLYNAALEERCHAWRLRQATITYGTQSAQLKQIRRGTMKTLQLKPEHRRWYVIVVAESEPAPLPATGREVGIDVAVARFLTACDGELVPNPRFLAGALRLTVDLQRRQARARPESGNRKRIRHRLAREWRKVRNRRRDFQHKTARALVNTCDAIGIQRLRIRNMTRRPKPKPGPDRPGGYLPNRAPAKPG
jgi:putative transposase